MLTVSAGAKVYLAVETVDLRRGHDGLCALVRGALGLDPYGGHFFVFVGKRGDRIKILFWDRGGFVVYYKRLASAANGSFLSFSVPFLVLRSVMRVGKMAYRAHNIVTAARVRIQSFNAWRSGDPKENTPTWMSISPGQDSERHPSP